MRVGSKNSNFFVEVFIVLTRRSTLLIKHCTPVTLLDPWWTESMHQNQNIIMSTSSAQPWCILTYKNMNLCFHCRWKLFLGPAISGNMELLTLCGYIGPNVWQVANLLFYTSALKSFRLSAVSSLYAKLSLQTAGAYLLLSHFPKFQTIPLTCSLKQSKVNLLFTKWINYL